MAINEPKFKRKAELNGVMITIYADSKTIVTRRFKESDKEEWPELFKAKKKRRGRPPKNAVTVSAPSEE